MTYTVCTVSGLPSGWGVLLGLAFKRLAYDVSYLQLSSMEHKSEEYLSLNLRGKVPILLAGDEIIRGSIAIFAWLDREHSDTPLFGRSADDALHIWQMTIETEEYSRPAFQGVFTPILIRGESYDQAEPDGRERLQAAAEVLSSELNRLESIMAAQGFMANHQPSAADCVTFPEIQIMRRALNTKSADMKALGLSAFETDSPKLSEWSDRMLTLPGLEATTPIH